jgi:hypothetical protein
MFAGRSMDTKRRLFRAIVTALEPFDVPTDDILIVLHEAQVQNWESTVASLPARST